VLSVSAAERTETLEKTKTYGAVLCSTVSKSLHHARIVKGAERYKTDVLHFIGYFEIQYVIAAVCLSATPDVLGLLPIGRLLITFGTGTLGLCEDGHLKYCSP
jgi:hypothetical protein